jgi:hypothetical protein
MKTITENNQKLESGEVKPESTSTQTSEFNPAYPHNIIMLNPNELRFTTTNIELYHDAHVTTDLEYSIKKAGIINPIVVNEKNEVLSGMRRTQAARKLNLATIPAYVVQSDSINYSMEVHANINRKKTYEIIMREAEMLEMELLNEKNKTSTRHMIDHYPTGIVKDENKSAWSVNKFISNLYGIGDTYLKYLKKIKTANPHLISDIDYGRISVEKAYKQSIKKNRKPNEKYTIEKHYCPACNNYYKKPVLFVDEEATPTIIIPTIRYIKFGQIYDVTLYKNKLSKTAIEGERLHQLEDHFSGRLAPEEIAPAPKSVVDVEPVMQKSETQSEEVNEINPTIHE